MRCPRCGNEWDATKGACTRCGFVARSAVGQSGSFPNQLNTPQRSSQPSGGIFNAAEQQSNDMTSLKQQSGELNAPLQPGFPVAGRPITTAPIQSSHYGFTNSPSPYEKAFAKPTSEKNVPKGMPQSTQQTKMGSTGSLSYTNAAQGQASSSAYAANRSIDYPQQDMRRSQSFVQPQTPVRQYPSESLNRNIPYQQMPRPASSFQQAPDTPSQMKSNIRATNVRPLLPGVLLRGGRYRLQELRERQGWLLGVFEDVWIGKDAHRAGSQVMITEVVLPENTSVMTQTILRTATMALATVGRNPHIPSLWDAFSDQGRSFFVFELLSQQSPQLVHGLIRPEHIILSRNNSQYILTNFSIVLAGGGTQYIAGMERSYLSAYTSPEFIRGVVDVRTDMYSLIATAYHAVTGSVPAGISGSIPQAQRLNPNVSSAFDAILSKGLRTVPNQRYQRPSELRQDLLAMRSVSGTLVPGQGSNPVLQNNSPSLFSKNGQQTSLPTQHTADQVAQALPLLLNTYDDMEDQVLLLPKPEDLPPMKGGNDTMNAAILLSLILVVLVAIVILSQMMY